MTARIRKPPLSGQTHVLFLLWTSPFFVSPDSPSNIPFLNLGGVCGRVPAKTGVKNVYLESGHKRKEKVKPIALIWNRAAQHGSRWLGSRWHRKSEANTKPRSKTSPKAGVEDFSKYTWYFIPCKLLEMCGPFLHKIRKFLPWLSMYLSVTPISHLLLTSGLHVCPPPRPPLGFCVPWAT